MARILNTCEQCGELMELDDDHDVMTGYHLFKCESCGCIKRHYSYFVLAEGGFYDA